MKEIKSIIKLYESYKPLNERAAIAQVVSVEESSYRREGARMIVFESGVFEGGISGGCLEGDALQKSQIAILKQQPSVVTYDTSKDKEIGIGLGCNGVINVLISPITSKASIIDILKKCAAHRREHIIATITAFEDKAVDIQLGTSYYYDTASKVLHDCENDTLKTYILDKVEDVLQRKKSKTYQFDTEKIRARIFIEFIPPQFHLAIYGDNYDVYPMIAFANVLDWDVSLVGNIQKLKKEKLKTVTNLFHKDTDERPEIDTRTAAVLMAHDYKTDCENMKVLLESNTPYIASLGPRKRFEKMLTTFKEKGLAISEENQKRIFAPCGLEIGATTPEEIATSIFGEILSVFSKNKGGMLRHKIGPIHDRE